MQPVASESKEIICSLAEAVHGLAPSPWLGEGKLYFPLVPESLELKTVPGVCHEEMTTCFCNAEGNQGPAIRWPAGSESRAGASCQPLGQLFPMGNEGSPCLLGASQTMAPRTWGC